MKVLNEVIRALAEHAFLDAPKEACGYLAERDGVVVSAYKMKNIDESGEHFSLDPQEQFTVVRSIREKGLRPAAVYHSHPETPARPSQEDIRLAYDPHIAYVIVSLGGGSSDIKAFRIRKGEVEEESIEVVGK